MKRSNRREIARNTLKILEQGFYLNQHDEPIDIQEAQENAVQNTQLYTPDELVKLIEEDLPATDFETEFAVNGLTTLDSARVEYTTDNNILCLNFASARNPGGGFLNGSQAQEESIARASGLYPCLLSAENYYKVNRAYESCLYTDHIIYSPSVPIFKDEKGNVMDDYITSTVITAPAVNTGVVLRNEPDNIEKIAPVMERRIDMVLAISKAQGHETLILGAWGCGVFRNDPKVIAAMFKKLLTEKYSNQFKKVVFSVYAKDERFITPFKDNFL